jgi:hypothetical protein
MGLAKRRAHRDAACLRHRLRQRLRGDAAQMRDHARPGTRRAALGLTGFRRIDHVEPDRPRQLLGQRHPVEIGQARELGRVANDGCWVVEVGVGRAGHDQPRHTQRRVQFGDGERTVLTVQEKVVEPRIPGLVVAYMGVSPERVPFRHALENGAGGLQPILRRAGQEPPEGRLQRVDPGPPMRGIDHEAHPAPRRQRARERIEPRLRVGEVVEHAATVDVVEFTEIPGVQ